jgi:hypothetical protein
LVVVLGVEDMLDARTGARSASVDLLLVFGEALVAVTAVVNPTRQSSAAEQPLGLLGAVGTVGPDPGDGVGAVERRLEDPTVVVSLLGYYELAPV